MAIIYRLIHSITDGLKAASGLATIKTHTVYLPSLEDCVVIDLGANVGQFASAMAARGLTCHAVEALPDLYREIPNDKNIEKHNLAISDRNEPLQLFISENPECNSIQSSFAAEFGLLGTVTCQGITFERFLRENDIDRVGLLKIDIEGSEEVLFDSTSDDLLRKAIQITIEFHDFVSGSISSIKVKQIVQRLRSLGFYCIPFSYMNPKMLTADFLFIQCGAAGVNFFERGCFAAITALLNLQRMKAHYLENRGNAEVQGSRI